MQKNKKQNKTKQKKPTENKKPKKSKRNHLTILTVVPELVTLDCWLARVTGT